MYYMRALVHTFGFHWGYSTTYVYTSLLCIWVDACWCVCVCVGRCRRAAITKVLTRRANVNTKREMKKRNVIPNTHNIVTRYIQYL